MQLVDRHAILVRPAQPFIDWVRQVDIDDGREPLPKEAIVEGSNIYLLPAYDYLEDTEAALREQVTEIFEAELAGWYLDASLWPEKRDWETFDAWMEWQIHDMVLDLVPSPIAKEPYDSLMAPLDIGEALFGREQAPYRSAEPDVGRNDPCPCGSGLKYKKCCMKS